MRDVTPLRHALQRATPAIALGTAALTAVLAACSDAPTSPPRSVSAARVPGGESPAYSTSTGSSVSVSSTGGSSTVVSVSSGTGSADTSRVTFTITPTSTVTFTLGVHKVQIAAGSVCAPATSGYGPTLWDTACKPMSGSLTVSAKSWTLPNGRPAITFSPDLRFVPGKVNTLWLLDRAAAASATGTINWCPTGGGACVNELASDPSLATHYDGNGFAYRRIKHFSGYTVIVN